MDDILIGMVGDVHACRPRPVEAFSQVKDLLEEPDLLFGNLEGSYVAGPAASEDYRGAVAGSMAALDDYAALGFDVFSLANNHACDRGPQALLDVRERLAQLRIAPCGAGASLTEARQPAIVHAGGLTVAWLAHTTIYPQGSEAGPRKPGVAAIRVHTRWEEVAPGLAFPGALPFVVEDVDEPDLVALDASIAAARAKADLVIASFHWGDQLRTRRLTQHEKTITRRAIDAGADMVVGHHQHAVRGMEWFRGRPILYGLGHFVFDVRWRWTKAEAERFAVSRWGQYSKQIGYDGGPRRGWPLLAFPPEFRLTMLAWAEAGRSGVHDIGFVPCRLARDGVVHPLHLDTAPGRRALRYVESCNLDQELDGRCTLQDAPLIGGFQAVRVVPR